MAKRGEIDPWNIDVVDVTDKFLKRLEEAKKLDLRISGRVLLYAAILVRIKADEIADEIAPQSESEEVAEVDWEIIEEKEEIDDLTFEEFLKAQRRRVRKISTLKDLIVELKKAEAIELRRRKKKRKEKVDYSFVVRIPHEENLEEKLEVVERRFLDALKNKEKVSFFSVVDENNKKETVEYYTSLLYLVQRRKLWMEQREIYEDIEVSRYLN